LDGRPTQPRLLDETRQRDHLQGSHQPFSRFGQLTKFFFQDRKESGLKDIGELRDLLAKAEFHRGPDALYEATA
jgi:hypothetical protein